MRIRAILLTLLCSCALPARAAEPPALWLYHPTNLGVEQNIDKLEELWKRAAAAGYSKVMLADSKFAHLEDMNKDYFKNCDRVKKIAATLHMQIVPSVFPIGYSNDILFHDPNLAEGLPVRDQLFVVNGGEARLEADPPVALKRVSFKDETVDVADGTATFRPGRPVTRLVFSVPVAPYRCYHVSVMIRSKDLSGEPEIHARGTDRDLNYKKLGVKPTQDWTRHDVVFNSLDAKEVAVYLGVWSQIKGELAWKDWKIEEVGLLNVLRRDGTPCVVKADANAGAAAKTYVEGKDYEPIVDPHMGNDPWPGAYKVWHETPTIHTKLPDGTRLRVSWYHPVIIYDEQVSMCISEPKTMQLMADQAKRMRALWGAPLSMMEHDEFRTCNYDLSCEKRHLTPGAMLADNVRRCTALLRPQRAAVWNDMFDPFHNAVKGPYYLVNGPWLHSWDGLDKDVLIMNWNDGHRDESLKFFADRGHEQVIAGFYDNDMSDWTKWLAASAKVKGVVGYMYTTWRADYSKLEEFAQMSRK